MRFNKGTIQLLKDGFDLVRTSWTDGSYITMNAGGVIYLVRKNKKGKGKETREVFNHYTQGFDAEDYDIKRTYNDHSR